MRAILWSILAVVALGSCEKALIRNDKNHTSNEAIFEQCWQFANDEYSYFEYKNINWDSVYTEFKPLAIAAESNTDLFKVLADMLYLMRDGHVNLRSSFNFSRNWRWYLDYPNNFNYDVLERNYFNEQEQFMGPFIIKEFPNAVYFLYSSFSNTISNSHLQAIFNLAGPNKNLILDVRDNGGGSLANVTTLINAFANESKTVAYERYKVGPLSTDFTNYIPITTEPEDYDNKPTQQIFVLTNRKCYSATTFLATMCKALPNVTLIGDTTGGGGGAPSATELANGWTVRVSNTQLFTLDTQHVEHGVPCDIYTTTNSDSIDFILEKALELSELD